MRTDTVQSARQAAANNHHGTTADSAPATAAPAPATRRYFTVNMKPTLKGKRYAMLGEDRMKLPEHQQMTGTFSVLAQLFQLY